MDFAVVDEGVDRSLPLIFRWEIRDAIGTLQGPYVGKAKAGASRPLKHYSRNVANIIAGKPYRKNEPTDFRRVHHALGAASSEVCRSRSRCCATSRTVHRSIRWGRGASGSTTVAAVRHGN